jgi:lipopolysaccharide transport system permease protein
MNSGQELIIEAGRTERHYWADIWRYRELFVFLAWRDILVRYKQTSVGIAWSVIRPFLTMLVFTFVFSKLAKLPSPGVAYPLLVFSALLPWQFFSSAVSGISSSLVGNANLLSKVYFPRLIIPMSVLMVNLVDFLIALGILSGMMIWYQTSPSTRIIAIPAFMLLGLIASLGLGLWMASLNVKYRDFGHIVPFIMMVGLYISPVGFASSIVPGKWRLIYSLNPMVGVIDGFRWALLNGEQMLYWPSIALSVLVSLAMLFSGIFYFRKVETTFADLL